MLGPRELLLFGHALRQGWRAQAIRRGVPLPEVIARLCASRGLPARVRPEDGVRATIRACTRIERHFGGLDSCLVRSLVLGSLLADQERVRMHIGVRRTDDADDPLAGHAWISLAATPILPDRDDGEPFTEVHTIDFERRRAS